MDKNPNHMLCFLKHCYFLCKNELNSLLANATNFSTNVPISNKEAWDDMTWHDMTWLDMTWLDRTWLDRTWAFTQNIEFPNSTLRAHESPRIFFPLLPVHPGYQLTKRRVILYSTPMRMPGRYVIKLVPASAWETPAKKARRDYGDQTFLFLSRTASCELGLRSTTHDLRSGADLRRGEPPSRFFFRIISSNIRVSLWHKEGQTVPNMP